MPSTLYEHPELHSYLDARIVDTHHQRILKELAKEFDFSPGDRVVEIGAGSGRYTEWLLKYGLRVAALEPDSYLRRGLEQRIGYNPSLTILETGLWGLAQAAPDVRFVCGFHVLHHLDAHALEILAGELKILSRNAVFGGWFFLEPNPRSPFYPAQIALTPGMKFSEEIGIWKNDYDAAFRHVAEGGCDLGTVGLFPPRTVVGLLPSRIQGLGTRRRTGPSFLRLYKICGHRSDC